MSLPLTLERYGAKAPNERRLETENRPLADPDLDLVAIEHNFSACCSQGISVKLGVICKASGRDVAVSRPFPIHIHRTRQVGHVRLPSLRYSVLVLLRSDGSSFLSSPRSKRSSYPSDA
jgi:hypothetical protein